MQTRQGLELDQNRTEICAAHSEWPPTCSQGCNLSSKFGKCSHREILFGENYYQRWVLGELLWKWVKDWELWMGFLWWAKDLTDQSIVFFITQKGDVDSVLRFFQSTAHSLCAKEWNCWFRLLHYCFEKAQRSHQTQETRDVAGGANRQTDQDFYLHQDNASPHVSAPTLAFIGSNNIKLLPHPQYSPDLAQCDFFIFPYLKKQLRSHRFPNLDALKVEIKRVLTNMSEDLFEMAIRNLAVWWKKCEAAEGHYFEGCKLEIDDISEAEVTTEESASEPDTPASGQDSDDSDWLVLSIARDFPQSSRL